MLKFESFNLPTDGLTRVALVDHYSNSLEQQGWSLVGMAETTDSEGAAKIYGVYRLSSDAAVVDAMKRAAEAEKKAAESAQKLSTAEYDNRQQSKRIAELVDKQERLQRLESLTARARERFGQAFADLERATSHCADATPDRVLANVLRGAAKHARAALLPDGDKPAGCGPQCPCREPEEVRRA